jgi:hypothetical protein
MGCGMRELERASRRELTERGYLIGQDTAGPTETLYIQGEGDRVLALFEIKATASEAFHIMYQGSWPSSMPRRFAVLPLSEKSCSAVEVLLQAGVSVLFYVSDGNVEFVGLDVALPTLERASGSPAQGPINHTRRQEALPGVSSSLRSRGASRTSGYFRCLRSHLIPLPSSPATTYAVSQPPRPG